ncbi:MAG TPA: DNA polymerase IV [Polyangiaceae bacterium]|nr:DNA polymerase IV [Polyangiaceae bacterium]
MTRQRWILHADMDAFYASIEQRDRPELRGLPVIVGATSARGVVAAASYEARRFGVHSAMPGFRARELCPGGVFLPSNMARYQEVSRQVREVWEEFTDAIEPLALDEAFLDISGSLGLYGTPLALARRLKQRVLEAVGLRVSVGVAPTKLVAKIACTLGKPDGLSVVLPGEVQSLLDPLPVRKLWGVGPALADKLALVNITSIRQLRLYDAEWLRRLLGDRAVELQARARGEDAREVESARAPKSYGEENTFLEDVSDRDTLVAALTAHSEAVARRVRRDGFVGRTVTVKIKLAQRQRVSSAALRSDRLYPVLTRQKTLPEPTDDAAVLRRVAVQLWDDENVGVPIRLIGLSLSGLEAREQLQLGLFEPASGSAIGPTLDAIQERFGVQAIRRGSETPEKVTPSLRWKRGE